MKKLGQVLAIILVIVGLFWAGWAYREHKYKQELNAAFQPAQQMTDLLVNQSATNAYALMPESYKSSADQAKFNADIASAIIKGSQQNSLSVYTGADEGLAIFDIADKDGTSIGSLTISTSKQDGKWTISYAQFSKK